MSGEPAHEPAANEVAAVALVDVAGLRIDAVAPGQQRGTTFDKRTADRMRLWAIVVDLVDEAVLVDIAHDETLAEVDVPVRIYVHAGKRGRRGET